MDAASANVVRIKDDCWYSETTLHMRSRIDFHSSTQAAHSALAMLHLIQNVQELQLGNNRAQIFVS